MQFCPRCRHRYWLDRFLRWFAARESIDNICEQCGNWYARREPVQNTLYEL